MRPPACEKCREPMRCVMAGGHLDAPGVATTELWTCRQCQTQAFLMLDSDGAVMTGGRFVFEPCKPPDVVTDSEADAA